MGIYNTEDSMNYEQRMAKVMLDIKVIRPYYSAIYNTLKRIKSESIPTIGVTTNTLVFNPKFIELVTLTEFMFISLHEVAHTALMHPARRDNRDAKLWNIACDIYVNRVLACEFGLVPGKTTSVDNIPITMPNNGLYCSSVDIHVDYAESIYEDLLGQLNGQSGQGGQGGQTSQSGQKGQSGRSGQEKQGKQGGESGGTGSKIIYHGSSESISDEYSNLEIDIDDESYCQDLIDNGKDRSEKIQESNRLISDAVVRVEMSSQAVGHGTNSLLALSKKMLESKIDWKRLLRKYLVSASSKDSSFSMPDKRMTYQKCIYPGQYSIDSNEIRGIKVCIDTSYSVSDTDINYFCGQVYLLLKEFKVQAELVYWDDVVQETHDFTDYKDFDKVPCRGRGGTSPNCIFDYLSSRQCKVKPIVTLVFTDGYYGDNWDKAGWKSKYKDTIWVMTRDYNRKYVPPFGKLAFAKFQTD